MVGPYFLDSPSRQALQNRNRECADLSPFYFTIGEVDYGRRLAWFSEHDNQFMTATLTAVVLRVGFAKLLSGVFGPLGIWLAWPMAGCWCAISISLSQRSLGGTDVLTVEH